MLANQAIAKLWPLGLWEWPMNLEAMNRYVLAIVGLFAALLYVGMVFAGLSEFISGLPKRGRRRKRSRTGGGSRRFLK